MNRDLPLFKLAQKETARQQETLDLIASENIAPPEVLALVGSSLMNKYSEGYPGKRYYPGNVVIDRIENLAISRARRAFGLSEKIWQVNVQPYSGSPANLETYFALMNFGDALLGMELAAGGHLTHGHRVNFSGQAYRALAYGVDPKTGKIDYGEVEKIAKKEKPKVIVSGLTAYPRWLDFKKFGEIARSVGAYHVADISHIAGLVAAKLHPSPFPYADVVTTTTHKTLRGPRGAVIFARKEIAEKIDRAVFPGMQGGPHDNITAALAYAFGQAATKEFARYAARVIENASALAGHLTHGGFLLATGGTDNHLMLVDLKHLGLNGKAAEILLERAGIIANRNSIPGDRSALVPSGIRIGTPAVTSRGFKKRDMKIVAEWIRRALIKRECPEKIAREVKLFLKKFPLPYANR